MLGMLQELCSPKKQSNGFSCIIVLLTVSASIPFWASLRTFLAVHLYIGYVIEMFEHM